MPPDTRLSHDASNTMENSVDMLGFLWAEFVCVCVWERERGGGSESARVRLCVCVCVWVCVCACVRACVRNDYCLIGDNGKLQYLRFCLFEMYISVVFVIRCLYSAVSLTLIREQRFIRTIFYYCYYYYYLYLYTLRASVWTYFKWSTVALQNCEKWLKVLGVKWNKLAFLRHALSKEAFYIQIQSLF